MRWLILLTLLLSACATAPAPDKRALAAEVFALSGGLEDMKLMARYAPLLVQGEDVKARCLEALGRDPNPLARAACDMAESAARGLARGQGGLQDALEAQIARMESRAVEAMADTYSTAELSAMRRHYASAEGRSIVAKRSAYLARLVGAR